MLLGEKIVFAVMGKYQDICFPQLMMGKKKNNFVAKEN